MTLKDLWNMKRQEQINKYPNFPPDYIVPKKYSDKKANGLTKCIVDFIRLSGGYADRINNMGVYRKGKGIIDRGHSVIIDNGGFTRSGSRKGIADIMGSYKGKMLAIEVKIGKDRLSEHQKQIQQEVIASGGIYIVARSWEQFYNDWSNAIPN